MLNKVSTDNASSQVLGALRAARNRIWRLLLTRTLLWLVNAGLGFSLALFLIEKNIYLPAGGRIAALAFFAAVLLLLAAYRVTKAAAGFGYAPQLHLTQAALLSIVTGKLFGR